MIIIKSLLVTLLLGLCFYTTRVKDSNKSRGFNLATAFCPVMLIIPITIYPKIIVEYFPSGQAMSLNGVACCFIIAFDIILWLATFVCVLLSLFSYEYLIRRMTSWRERRHQHLSLRMIIKLYNLSPDSFEYDNMFGYSYRKRNGLCYGIRLSPIAFFIFDIYYSCSELKYKIVEKIEEIEQMSGTYITDDMVKVLEGRLKEIDEQKKTAQKEIEAAKQAFSKIAKER